MPAGTTVPPFANLPKYLFQIIGPWGAQPFRFSEKPVGYAVHAHCHRLVYTNASRIDRFRGEIVSGPLGTLRVNHEAFLPAALSKHS